MAVLRIVSVLYLFASVNSVVVLPKNEPHPNRGITLDKTTFTPTLPVSIKAELLKQHRKSQYTPVPVHFNLQKREASSCALDSRQLESDGVSVYLNVSPHRTARKVLQCGSPWTGLSATECMVHLRQLFLAVDCFPLDHPYLWQCGYWNWKQSPLATIPIKFSNEKFWLGTSGVHGAWHSPHLATMHATYHILILQLQNIISWSLPGCNY